MKLLIFLLQFDLAKFTENIFGGQVLERTPAGLTIVYLIGTGVLVLFLMLSFFRAARPKFAFEENLPKEVSRRLSLTMTNRSLKSWLFVFICLASTVYGFHVYWTYFAAKNNEDFRAVSNKDLRNRRTSASTLRGWMLDRTGKLDKSLAFYKLDKEGKIDREFPLEKEMAHLLGTEFGTPGLERTLYTQEADTMPEAWEVLTKVKRKEPENKDVKITIDHELQKFAAKQLEGKKGAVVAINPQNGNILAMYSNPTYSLKEAESFEGNMKLEADKANKPLLNRAHREFYIPGSTFKTFTMIAAFRAGAENSTFPVTSAGYEPFKGSRIIRDTGSAGCHPCSDSAEMKESFQLSSNQYFAQLANALGNERMSETAIVLGIKPVETAVDALKQGFFPDIWNTSNPRIARAIMPARATLVTGKQITKYDSGVIGMGQGGAGQMTPFQMALIAAAAGNTEGKLMKPKIEADVQSQMFNQILTPQQAEKVREIMATVTQEGTGTRVKQDLEGTGITTGGKTGTSDRDSTPLYNKDGTRKMNKVRKKNADGVYVDAEEPATFTRWDGWFIGIAPLDNSQIAIAVVVEDIGEGKYGGGTAGPIAAAVIKKAAELGLLGEQYKPKTKQEKKKNQRQ